MDRIKEIFDCVKNEKRTVLLEYEAKEVLSNIGINLPPSILVRTEEEAVNAFIEFGKNIAMKLMSTQVLHKTDAGAVFINIDTEDKVRGVYNDFMTRFKGFIISGVFVEKMVKEGIEIIIGTQVDKTFGPVILVGPGGVLVEAMRDVVFRMCPVSKESAYEAISEIKAQTILNGFRGMPKVNKDELAELMVKLSKLAWDHRYYLSEMDINPIICNEKGIYPVDARMILKELK